LENKESSLAVLRTPNRPILNPVTILTTLSWVLSQVKEHRKIITFANDLVQKLIRHLIAENKTLVCVECASSANTYEYIRFEFMKLDNAFGKCMFEACISVYGL
jgi:hypothetical protein